jgi:hypothetical protein
MTTKSAPSLDESLPDRVRAACAEVAAAGRSVRIEEEAITPYAAGLPAPDPVAADPALDLPGADRETRAAFVVCLDAINFGSGWWPTIRKRPGHSGFFTVAAGLQERFQAQGPWDAAALRRLTAADLAATLGQDPGHPLMADFAASLRDVGAHLATEHDGRFTALVDATDSAPALAGLLAEWRAFADTSIYMGRPVPFFKRAQLAAADLARAGVAELSGLDRLTAFADNLVPHVLHVDGVLRLDPELEAAIDAEALLEHGSPAEVELRACAVHAVELLTAARTAADLPPLTPAEIDAALWNRGRAPRYKSRPRPRSRNTAY